MKKYLIFVVLILFIPFVYGIQGVFITMGETTYNNPTYKGIILDYFQSMTDKKIENVKIEVIRAPEVNEVSKDITGYVYTSDEIFSCAMVDLNYTSGIKVVVDKSKIEVVTPPMYVNALKSAGIDRGYVVVSSPVPASGEAALAGIMKSYEIAVGAEIPKEAKKAAFEELYLETKLVNETGISGDTLANFIGEVKNKSESQNLKNPQEIRQVVINVANNMNINLTNTQIEEISQNIANSQRVQDLVYNFEQKLDKVIQQPMPSILDQLYSWLQSLYNYLEGLLSA